jgi:hypothetical protein
MDPHEFSEETGTNILSAPPHTARSVDVVAKCALCGAMHYGDTPCPRAYPRAYPPKTVRVRLAVALYEDGHASPDTVRSGDDDLAMDSACCLSMHGRVIGRRFVEFDMQPDEIPTVEARVVTP